jgi:predicted metalloprotease
MLWQRGRQSDNVEDRRGMGVGRAGGIGIGTIAIALIAMFLGFDPGAILSLGGGTGQQPSAPRSSGGEDEAKQFVAAVLGTTEDVWTPAFADLGKRYEKPTLVLFSGAVNSACGMAQSATGPFYCPGDQKVYLDTNFFDDLGRRFGAPGDFAAAYVIAHEVGHHVQNQLGIMPKIQALQQRVSRTDANRLSVMLELQADCLAGVWARRAHENFGILEKGDLAEALGAAAAVGDDRLQRQSTGTVVPDSFTHGSSEERMRWFKVGVDSGEIRSCDTFAGTGL